MRIEWTVSSLADLDRFAQFLHERDPALATRIAAEIRESAQILADQPLLGRRLGEREEYREPQCSRYLATTAAVARSRPAPRRPPSGSRAREQPGDDDGLPWNIFLERASGVRLPVGGSLSRT